MFFRNLFFFRFAQSLARRISELDPSFAEQLRDFALKPVGPLELQSVGFVSPFGRNDDRLTLQLEQCIWFTVGTETRIMPPAAVDAEVAKRVAAIEETTGRRLGGKARRQVKEDVVHELLPRAFVKPARGNCYLDLRRGLLVVDTSSRKTAEGVVSLLRRALGSFPALPLATGAHPRTMLTDWLQAGARRGSLHLGDECVLKEGDSGASARFANQELSSDEIREALDSGKTCAALGVTLGDSMSFVLSEDLCLRKFKLMDGVLDKLEEQDRDSLEAELLARFALFSGVVGRGFDELAGLLQLVDPDSDAPPKGFELERTPSAAARRLKDMATEDGGTMSVTVNGNSRLMNEVAADLRSARIPVVHADEADPLYGDAVKHVRETNRASISSVQRVLKIGYNRAARLLEAMETAGVVSRQASNGDRTVLPF